MFTHNNKVFDFLGNFLSVGDIVILNKFPFIIRELKNANMVELEDDSGLGNEVVIVSGREVVLIQKFSERIIENEIEEEEP